MSRVWCDAVSWKSGGELVELVESRAVNETASLVVGVWVEKSGSLSTVGFISFELTLPKGHGWTLNRCRIDFGMQRVALDGY